jgi:hypothetical protein
VQRLESFLQAIADGKVTDRRKPKKKSRETNEGIDFSTGAKLHGA